MSRPGEGELISLFRLYEARLGHFVPARPRAAFGLRELAPAFPRLSLPKSAGKPDALHTLRENLRLGG